MGLRMVFFGIVVVTIYTVVTVYIFNYYVKTGKKLHSSKVPNQLLILVSQPRSGSTFLGGVISKSLRSIYFYEPLYQLDKLVNIDINFATGLKRQKYDKIATQYLQNIFKCDFKRREEWIHIFKSPFKSISTLQGNECKEKDTRLQYNQRKDNNKRGKGYRLDRCMPYLNSFHLEKECQTLNLMVKLLEMRIPDADVSNLQNLMENRISYKIVYLVRDPRASLWSLLRTGWVAQSSKNKHFQEYVPLRCEEMYKNIRAVKKQQHIILLRYEDLIVKPQTVLQTLYNFIGEEISQRMHDQLKRIDCYVPIFNNWYNKTSTHGEVTMLKSNNGRASNETVGKHVEIHDDDIDFNAIRNKHRQNYECFSINKWRYTANVHFIKLVEDNCNQVMKAMGYRLIDQNFDLVQDVKHSLVSPDFDIR